MNHMADRGSAVCFKRILLGRTTSWSPKSQCVYGPENEIAEEVTFFAKNGQKAIFLQV